MQSRGSFHQSHEVDFDDNVYADAAWPRPLIMETWERGADCVKSSGEALSARVFSERMISEDERHD